MPKEKRKRPEKPEVNKKIKRVQKSVAQQLVDSKFQFGEGTKYPELEESVFHTRNGYDLKEGYADNSEFLKELLTLLTDKQKKLKLTKENPCCWYVCAILYGFESQTLRNSITENRRFHESGLLKVLYEYSRLSKEKWLYLLSRDLELILFPISRPLAESSATLTVHDYLDQIDIFFTNPPTDQDLQLKCYINLCGVWRDFPHSRERVITLILEHKTNLSSLLNQKIRNTNDKFAGMESMPKQTEGNHALGKQVQLFTMNLLAAYNTPSLHLAQGSTTQLQGDGRERFCWFMGVATGEKYQAHVSVIPTNKTQEDKARTLLQKTYGEAWMQLQFDISQLCNETGLVFAHDIDTFSNQHTHKALCTAMGAVDAAVNAALTDQQHAVCVVRPPGHHHEKNPQGFCQANYVAAKAIESVKKGHRVLIIDCDAHFGDGTQALIIRECKEHPELAERIRFVNSFMDDEFPFLPDSTEAQTTHDRQSPYVSSDFHKLASDYKNQIYNIPFFTPRDSRQSMCSIPKSGESTLPHERMISTLKQIQSSSFDPSVILLSMGTDAHASEGMTRSQWSTDHFTELFKCIGEFKKPIVSVTEGGYEKNAIEDVMHALMDELTEHRSSPNVAQKPLSDSSATTTTATIPSCQ